jgi:2-polyprenyl-3-methyl-5-hydroxy-6-metoxy-1,4-benzoquinol methylase
VAVDWDARYRAGERGPGEEPSALLVRMAHLLPAEGRALDVAAGAGRNAVFLAERGLAVDAVDHSREGLRIAGELARTRGVTIATIVADLQSFDPGDARYDVVVNFHYLQRSLVPRLRRAVRPGGLVLFETYTIAQRDLPTGPSNPDYLLEPGELETLFAGFEILLCEETVSQTRALASLVARRPAVPCAY